MYEGDGEPLDTLTVWAGQSGCRLCWRALWMSDVGPETMYKLWINAGHLPPEQKKRAREKALRFLRGTSGCKPWPITVLSDSSRTLAVARRYVRAAIKELGTFAGSESRSRVLGNLVQCRAAKPRKGIDCLEDHFTEARTASFAKCAADDGSAYAIAINGRDMVLSEEHCVWPAVCPPATISECIVDAFRGWCTSIQITDDKADAVAANLATALHAGMAEGQRGQIRATLVKEIREKYVAEVCRNLGACCKPDEVLALPVDRDLRRRCFCWAPAYHMRLFSALESASTVYKPSALSCKEAGQVRAEAAQLHFKQFGKRKIPQQASRMYLLPKAKCFVAGKWKCEREHEHYRSIVAAPKDALTRRQSKCARALVVLARSSGMVSFPVRNQHTLTTELVAAHKRIQGPPTEKCRCCGCAKSTLCGCKLDAGSFFTACSRKRCVDLAAKLIQRFRDRGAECIWLARDKGTLDRMAKASTPVPNRFYAFSLDEAQAVLTWLLVDVWICAGDRVYIQLDGLSQGSPLSPILARIQLDVSHDCLYRRPLECGPPHGFVQRAGPACGRQVATVFHVDDSLWWAVQLCHACIVGIARECWPNDIGLTIEGTENIMDFLHLVVKFVQDRTNPRLETRVRLPNKAYALGLRETPAVCGLSPYVARLSTARHLRLFLSARLWCIAATYATYSARQATMCMEDTVISAVEAIRLGWPIPWIARLLLSAHTHSFRYYTPVLRKCGIWLRSRTRTTVALAVAGNSYHALTEYWIEDM